MLAGRDFIQYLPNPKMTVLCSHDAARETARGGGLLWISFTYVGAFVDHHRLFLASTLEQNPDFYFPPPLNLEQAMSHFQLRPKNSVLNCQVAV
jgi:hypothetical protein